MNRNTAEGDIWWHNEKHIGVTFKARFLILDGEPAARADVSSTGAESSWATSSHVLNFRCHILVQRRSVSFRTFCLWFLWDWQSSVSDSETVNVSMKWEEPVGFLLISRLQLYFCFDIGLLLRSEFSIFPIWELQVCSCWDSSSLMNRDVSQRFRSNRFIFSCDQRKTVQTLQALKCRISFTAFVKNQIKLNKTNMILKLQEQSGTYSNSRGEEPSQQWNEVSSLWNQA